MAKIVTFIQNNPPYNAGESAGFDDLLAYDLVAKGFAVPNSNAAIGPTWTADMGVQGQDVQQFQGGSAAAEADIQASHLEQS